MTKTLNNTAAKKLHPATVKARAKRLANQERAAQFAAMAFGRKATEVEYGTDKEGNAVRLTQTTNKEVAHFLHGRRAFDTVEFCEAIRADWLPYMEKAGYIVRHAPKGLFSGIYIITEKAAKTYGLPEFINGGMRACYARTA